MENKRGTPQDKSSILAVLQLPDPDRNGQTVASDDFVVESQDDSADLLNRTSSRSSAGSSPVPIKLEYDPDDPEVDASELLDADEGDEADDAEPNDSMDLEPSSHLFSEKSAQKKKSNVKQIEDVLNRVLDKTIKKFIAFEEEMDKRTREETNSFRNKLLAIERRKLEESSTQTLQNEKIINLMEALVSQER